MTDRRIQNDEQYHKSLDWLVTKAMELEHPLLEEEQRVQLMKKYDYVYEKITEYKDKKMKGLEFPEDDEPEQKQVNLADWLG